MLGSDALNAVMALYRRFLAIFVGHLHNFKSGRQEGCLASKLTTMRIFCLNLSLNLCKNNKVEGGVGPNPVGTSGLTSRHPEG